MKKNYSILSVFIFLFFIGNYNASAQAFRRGSLLISVSEGSTWANYNTRNIGQANSVAYHKCIDGVRDPLIIEYGITNKWSFGLSTGTDFFYINPSKAYDFRTSTNKVKASTSEFTFDANYHVFVNQRLDLSVFTSLGLFSISMKGQDNDFKYNYTSTGNIIRVGAKARYYFFRRFGAFGMMSSYLGTTNPKNIKGNTVASTYATNLNGFAIEAGLCYRILR